MPETRFSGKAAHQKPLILDFPKDPGVSNGGRRNRQEHPAAHGFIGVGTSDDVLRSSYLRFVDGLASDPRP